jgi:group I intron endonuclease
VNVYLITNLRNGKRYVGQTTTSLRRRFQAHVDHSRSAKRNRSKSALCAAILKYGRDAFTIRLLQSCATQEELDEAERRWISELKTLAPRGYNLRSGGSGAGSHSESTKEKLRGYERTPEWRAKLSASMRGRKASEEALRNLDKGRRAQIEFRRASGIHKGEGNPNARLTSEQVLEIHKLYRAGAMSQSALAARFKVSQGAICAILKGRRWKHLLPEGY